jgi:hypothetical protein
VNVIFRPFLEIKSRRNFYCSAERKKGMKENDFMELFLLSKRFKLLKALDGNCGDLLELIEILEERCQLGGQNREDFECVDG